MQMKSGRRIACLLLLSSTALAAAVDVGALSSSPRNDIVSAQDIPSCLGDLCIAKGFRSAFSESSGAKKRNAQTRNLDHVDDRTTQVDVPADGQGEVVAGHQPRDDAMTVPPQSGPGEQVQEDQDHNSQDPNPESREGEESPPGYQPVMTTLPEYPPVEAVQPDPYEAPKENIFRNPESAPEIEVRAIGKRDGRETKTQVTISWRGEADVQSWKLSKTTQYGSGHQLVQVQQNRKEVTTIVLDGYCSYVVVGAVDREGKSLGQSSVIEAVPPDDLRTAAVAKEHLWQQDMGSDYPFPLQVYANVQSTTGQSRPPLTHRTNGAPSNGTPTASFLYGILCCLGMGLIWRINQSRTPILLWLRGILSHGHDDSIELNKVS